ncbi:MAG: hypothetical protein RBR32_01630 [Bacteroidales bacterium]|nr:hypothetical protein [Bacteroidales bacterium]
MSELVRVGIEDFSELGQPFEFTYFKNKYYIGPISPFVAKRLIAMGREITNKAKENDKKLKELEENKQEIPEELAKDMEDIFDFQMNFIIASGLEKYNEEGNLESVEKSELEKTWSTKLVTKIFEKVNQIVVGEIDQEKKS